MYLIAGHVLNDGDVVVTDVHPGEYLVVALHETKAWIREIAGERDLIVDYHRCAPADRLH
ncbi:MAG TPA: hypothetical protein VFF48_01775 [Brevundimonas sp.]|nr:hypothetical protein [Brevundimonas sp.]